MEQETKFNRDNRPDAQPFDEIRVKVVPRYKQSELSGDEWRISTLTQFYRKGRLIFETGHGTMEATCGLMYADYLKATEHGSGKVPPGVFYGGEGDFCDQEGCAETATVTYQKKLDYCRSGHRRELHRPTIRKFCSQHKTRGDCGLDDADANYVRV